MVQAGFGPATQKWFDDIFPAPTRVQQEGWPLIQQGHHTLLFAPTGSGKTLAAFLSCIDHLFHEARAPDADKGFRAIYVSPLKALVYDVDRNLRSPLVGIGNAAARLEMTGRNLGVDIRTGDTPQKDRQRMVRHPGDILVTTPESLYLMLTSQAREMFRTVETIIIDEIHVMAGTKRGAHLALTLERLSRMPDNDPQRIGLSATQRPLEAIARYLGGPREVRIVDAGERPHIDIQITVPVDDMENPPLIPAPPKRDFQYPGHTDAAPDGAAPGGAKEQLYVPQTEGGIWPNLYPQLLEQIRAHRSTILFCNSRLLCERLARKLNELAGEELVRTHHGSISHEKRRDVEEALKEGRLPAIVATSSLELGIDMGAVDLVILIESPGAVSRGLQRIGRAGHGVGQISRGIVFPKYRGDLLECAVVARGMLEGEIEPTAPPSNCLDVLAQHIVAMVAMEPWPVDELYAFVRRSAPFAELSRAVFEGVLDMLSGRYPSDEFADLTPRVVWDRTEGKLSPRKNARMTAILNGGTIPDRGLYTVHLGADGKRLGELDEEMVFETRQGDTLILGATTWRVESITRDRVNVIPAPGEPGRLPFWRGERPGRPITLGRAMGDFLQQANRTKDRAQLRAYVKDYAPLDDKAADNLVAFLTEQREVCGNLPTAQNITVERFRDELGDWRICIMTPYGSRVHAPWALALENLLARRAGFDIDVMYTDDGLALRLVDADTVPELADFFPDPEELDALIREELGTSALFAARFRENAARALLLPRRRANQRTPLWMQRRRSQTLMSVATQYSAFPMVLETYRECLQDVFDLDALKDLLTKIRTREIRIDDVETKKASPFARSLVFQYVANYLYDTDAPSAERKAQALALDHQLLAELLGQEELRELLDEDAVASVEAELQHLEPERLAKTRDQLHDVLRRLGDLSEAELRARCVEPPSTMIQKLVEERRACWIRLAQEERLIAAEDAGRYAQALGVVLPPGLPAAFLEPSKSPLESLVARYARTHGPFLETDVAHRFGISAEVALAMLRGLYAEGKLVHGDIRPGGTRREWCDTEVLRRLKRRSLARLRQEIEPVEAPTYARFLAGWHGVDKPKGGPDRLLEVLEQLEGQKLSFAELCDSILPARVAGFVPARLDELGATGHVVWRGAGAVKGKDGRVAIFRRDRATLLAEPPDEASEVSAVQEQILAHLDQRGASFFAELQRATSVHSTKELLEELWDLVWRGEVTNDTFQPLLGLRARSTRRRPREIQMVGGRWSRFVHDDEQAATARTHALVTGLLERYGVVSREVVSAEAVPGGFTRVYPVLRAMEEGGQVRRGYFVEGFTGAQFALPGVVDRLRRHRPDDEDETGLVLCATDPAQPWGSLFKWPVLDEDASRPRRVPGAKVVLVGGLCVMFVERGLKSATMFLSPEDRRVEVAIRALADERGYRSWTLHKVNGQPSHQSAYAELLLAMGFTREPKGLTLAA